MHTILSPYKQEQFFDLQNNASTIFPGARAPTSSENPGSYQLLVEEIQKILKDPLQADKIAQALDTSEGELYRDFDLATFVDHFRLDAIASALEKGAARSLVEGIVRRRLCSLFPLCRRTVGELDKSKKPSHLAPPLGCGTITRRR